MGSMTLASISYIVATAAGDASNIASPAQGCVISGFAADENNVGVPNATVTLWQCHYDPGAGKYVNDGVLKMSGNPALSNSGIAGEATGTYLFKDVPAGIYNITVEKDGHRWYKIASPSPGQTDTENVVSPGYAYTAPQ